MDLLLSHVYVLLPQALDPVPQDDDVKAGWLAFWIFVALCVATALLCWSLVRQLRRTRDNAARGVFGPVDETSANGGRHQIPQAGRDGETDGPVGR